jgi:hypothetical protein
MFWKKKTAEKPEIKPPSPDYIALILDLSLRVETLEKFMAKSKLKMSPGRPLESSKSSDTDVVAEDAQFKILRNGQYIRK